MPSANTGFQPRNTPAERRAFFDLDRQLREANGETEDLRAYIDGEIAGLAATTAVITGAAGWANYGAGWAGCVVTKQGSIVTMQGLASRSVSTPFTGGLVGTIPVGFRPAENLLLTSIAVAATVVRLNVYPDGQLVLDSAPAVTLGLANWLSLNGFSWRAA